MGKSWILGMIVFPLVSAGTAATAKSGCSVTLSGAQTGTFACEALGRWEDGEGQISIGIADSQPFAGISLSVSFPGEVKPGRKYSSTDERMRGSAAVTNTDRTMWLAATEPGKKTKIGTFNVVVNRVRVKESIPGTMKSWEIHGTADATLSPSEGVTGEVVFHAEF